MRISIIIFDDFTDIDLFLMWDILGRKKFAWDVKILGNKSQHISSNGLYIKTQGQLHEASDADVVLFSSGKGTRSVVNDMNFLNSFHLDPKNQLVGSICSGALILGKLGLLKDRSATTHPAAKQTLIEMGIHVIDRPFVCYGNVATAGGCLSAQYLVAWVIEKTYGSEKRKEVMKEIAPVGQAEIYESLVTQAINYEVKNAFEFDYVMNENRCPIDY